MTQAIHLAFVESMADDCAKATKAVPYHHAAMKAHDRAENPHACRPGSPAVSNAYDESARHWLSALYVTAPPSMTTAERLLAAAIMASRAEGRELPIAALMYAGDGLAELLGAALETHIYEPGDVPDDAPEPRWLAAWEAAKTAAGAPPPVRVLVAIEGGLVQGAVADRPGVSVITLDYDTDGADPDEVFAIPQDDGSTSNATRGGVSVEHDPAWIDAAEAAELAEPEEAIALLRRRAKQYAEQYPEQAAEYRAQADAIAARLPKEEEELQLAEAPIGDPLIGAHSDA